MDFSFSKLKRLRFPKLKKFKLKKIKRFKVKNIKLSSLKIELNRFNVSKVSVIVFNVLFGVSFFLFFNTYNKNVSIKYTFFVNKKFLNQSGFFILLPNKN